MRSLLPLLVLLFISVATHAQRFDIPTTTWFRGGEGCFTSAYYCIGTGDGGMLFAGNTSCDDGGGVISASFPDIGGNTRNILIGKLDSNMHTSWVRVYGGTGMDFPAGVVAIAGGGYAVLSVTNSNDHDVAGNHGGYDMWLMRLDAAGNIMWQKCYGGANTEAAISIAQTPDGGFVLLGASYAAGGDVPAHYPGSDPNHDGDWFMVKTDAGGNIQWTKTIGGTGDEQVSGSVLVANNFIYMAGSSSSNDHDCTDSAWHTTKWTQYDYYVLKLDMSGNILWNHSYGGNGEDMPGVALWDSRDNSIVINGINGSSGPMVTETNGVYDMWVIKIDTNGILKWQKRLGSDRSEAGGAIALTPQGYIAYGNVTDIIFQHENIWLCALDMNGNLLATKEFGGTGHEMAGSIVPYKNGYAVTGTSNSPGFTGCTNVGDLPPGESAFISEMVFSPLGVPDIDPKTQQLTIFPNPPSAMGVAELILPNNGGGTIQMTTSLGQLVLSESVTPPTQHMVIYLKDLAKGLYIIRWVGNDGTVLTTKLIKS